MTLEQLASPAEGAPAPEASERDTHRWYGTGRRLDTGKPYRSGQLNVRKGVGVLSTATPCFRSASQMAAHCEVQKTR